MNAHALLSAQGWRGTGHSLHKTDDSIGLAKPLLLSRKDNTKGLGQKQHFTSDQWWMNAFDEQLKGLDTSKEGLVVQTITTGKLNGLESGKLGKWSVYATFVRGGFLEGTIGKLLELDSTTTETESDSDTDKDATKTMVAHPAEDSSSEEPRAETKEERRARRAARRQRKEDRAREKAARRERKKSGSSKSSSKSSRKSSRDSSDADEEKRRRRARKEQKRRQRRLKEVDT